MTDHKDPKPKASRLSFLRRPSTRYSLGAILIVGIATGVIFWGGFNTAMEATNTETFCISCHEMGDNVYPEYKETIHYSNRTGVRATCPDCHALVADLVAHERWHTRIVADVAKAVSQALESR